MENEWFIWFKLILNSDFNREELLKFKCSISVWLIPLKGNNWHQYYKWIFRTHRLSHCTWIRYHLIKKYLCFFISLQICHHNDIATVTTFSFSRTGGNWWLVPSPSSLCLKASIRLRFRTVHATGYRSAQERAWTLLQMLYFFYWNTMETTIGRIFRRWEKRKCNHVERQGVWVNLKHMK